MRIKYINFNELAASALTVLFLLLGLVTWPVAVVLLLLCCEVRRDFGR